MQKKLFTELGLAPELLKAITKVGYEEASPIQSAAIPALLAGSDVVGQSQTGSGKTAAYAVPAIQMVDASLHAPQVLILCPTRELVIQVAEEVAKLAFFKRGVRELPIYGGQSYERQFRGLQQGAQIIIGTPGRIMDHLDRGTLRLDKIKIAILDEADRMLDMGFVDDIKVIFQKIPAERQTLMFSATLPGPIRQLVKSFTRNPVNIKIEDVAVTIPDIDQVYYELDRRTKVEVLCRIIDLQDIKFGLIFCATKMMVDELAEHLVARGYSADKLHGDMTQAMRERVMAKFRKRDLEFLVATDVAARGVDVDDIEVVFNYDLPHDGEDYVHRIGRTGRAGRSGRAITFVAGREIWKLQNIMRATKGVIRRERVPSAEQVEQKRANAFFESLLETLEKGEYKRHDELIDRLLDQGHTPTDIASALIHLAGEDTPRLSERTPEEKPARPYPRPAQSEEIRIPRLQVPPARFGREPAGEAPSKSGKGVPPLILKGHRRDTAAPGAKRPFAVRDEQAEAEVSHEEGMDRLSFNLGRDQEIDPGDIVGVIAGVAKAPKEAIGAIHIMAKQTFVDVAHEHSGRVIEKLRGIKFKGHKLFVKVAK